MIEEYEYIHMSKPNWGRPYRLNIGMVGVPKGVPAKLFDTQCIYDHVKPRKLQTEAFIGHLVRSNGGRMKGDAPRTYERTAVYTYGRTNFPPTVLRNYVMNFVGLRDAETGLFLDDYKQWDAVLDTVKESKFFTFEYCKYLYAFDDVEVVL